MRSYAVTETSASAIEVATELNDDDHGQQVTIPDEDPGDEVVNKSNAVAEVTLLSTVRRSYLLLFIKRHQSGFLS